MSNKWDVKPEQAEFLIELEKIIGKSIPLVDSMKWDIVGVKVIGLGLYEYPFLIGLGLYDCELTILPESIGNLKSLQELNLEYNQLTTLPESIGNLQSLQELNLEHNQLTTLPESIGDLQSLQVLDLDDNKLTALPESIGDLQSLHTLSLSRNKLNTLPESIINLQSLQRLNLYNNQLTTLPESIGDLQSLQVLDLDDNKLTALPESIKDLQSLQRLNLRDNQLATLPESIGDLQLLQRLGLSRNKLNTLPEAITNLQSLHKLSLSRNKLNTLPEAIINLKSLRKLDLSYNQLTSLPDSIWLLKNLEAIELDGNPWEDEWKQIAKRDVPAIREFCRQRVTINIFISHTVSEFASYRIKELAEFLEQQPEINQVYFCEEDMKGNIDVWMEETVSKSQLLLFIGTQQSILSKDCNEELRLARVNKIPRIPIKGLDVSWQELAEIGLISELRFEFDKNNFNKFCEEIYQYIYKFKREKGLVVKEQEEIEKSMLEIINIFTENLNSDVYNNAFADNISDINALKKKLNNKQITFKELLINLGELLDQEDS